MNDGLEKVFHPVKGKNGPTANSSITHVKERCKTNYIFIEGDKAKREYIYYASKGAKGMTFINFFFS